MTTLLAIVALLTAVVIMVTKVVEFLATIRKNKAAQDAGQTKAARSGRPLLFWVLLWSNCAFSIGAIIYLGYLAAQPASLSPATKRDVIVVGLMVGLYVVGTVNNRPRDL